MNHLVRSRHFSRIIGLIVAAFAFGVYLKTQAPSVGFIDSGELVTVACTLGIAHPTGYPLFTLLGWVFARLPLASEAIVRLNLMATIFCAAGVYVFYLLMSLLLRVLSERSSALRVKQKDSQPASIIVASVSAALLLAFSETYWSQALSVEVYSLHLFLVALLLLTFFKATFSCDLRAEGEETRETVWWFLAAFTLGLSFTNHMTTILLVPGLAYVYFAKQGAQRASWRRLLLLSLPFVLGLSLYLYLPIRAAQSPLMNWGNPDALERFVWHITGKQYRVWIFSSTEAAGRQFSYFLRVLPDEVGFVGLGLGLIGVVALFRADRSVFMGTLLLFLTCVAYSINYDIHDIDSYFLLAYVTLVVWAGMGACVLIAWMRNTFRWSQAVVSTVIVGLGLVPLAYHYTSVDESEDYLVEDYTMNMFSSLKPQAVVLSYQWDYWVSASYYYQLVRGMRPDLVVIDKELLRRSWYLLELEQRFPWLMQQSAPEVEAFRKELYKFEHELPYDPNIIQARFVDMIRSFIDKNMSIRPVYVTNEIEPEFTGALQRVPEGLALRLASDTLFHSSKPPEFTYRPFGREGRLEGMVPHLYGQALILRGIYYYNRGKDLGEARRSWKLALRYDPSSEQGRRLLGQFGGP